MRVLLVVHALPPATYGGTELYTAHLAEAFARRGHEVGVATPRGTAAADLDGVAVHDLPEPVAADVQTDRGLPTGPVDPAVDARFDDLLASVDPDVVHLQHLKGLSATLPSLCEARGAACLLTLHDYWTLCHREQLHRPDGTRCVGPESTAKCTDCYLADRPFSAVESAVESRPPGEARPGAGAPSAGEPPPRRDGSGDAVREFYVDAVAARGRALRRALSAADRLISPSAFLRDRFVAFGVPPAHVVQRRNGILVDRFEDTGFDGPPVRIGYAGRIAPEKGVHLLLEAFSDLDGDATLEVFGGFDPDGDDYHARLAAAGDGVSFHGRYDDPATPYRAMDVFVLPAVWYENSPLVIQEAHASGVPVVTADVGGMAELVTDGVDGATFAVGDADALADALARLVRDPARLERLRDGVREPKRLADHADDLLALYADCRKNG
ncbi:glycosyltransferase family 4 protein [Halomarina halobia]|uniref:Glycosyltransferase family 4 protein n=1 Tax=Halomarina halobia TaxID=3033386 RepID=A0ABD6ADF4_9EURY|nr:glycosyltransferase family 4 protein [Halomarina sp. PSR21]